MLNFYYSQDEEASVVPSSEIPENLQAVPLPFARPTWTTGSFGNFLFQEIAHGHYGIGVTDFFIDKPVTFVARTEQPVVTFALLVSGNFICHPPHTDSIIMQEAHCYTFPMSPQRDTSFHLKRGHHRMVLFMFTDQSFVDYARRFQSVNQLKRIIWRHLGDDPQQLEAPFSLRTKAILYDIENFSAADEQPATNESSDYLHARIVEFLEDYSKILHQPAEARIRYGVLLKTFAERLLQVRAMIDQHEGKPLTIEQLGKKCGLNSKQLKTGFRKMFDITIDRYQLIRTIERAAHLLVSTSDTIDLICDMMGYDDRSSFTRHFKSMHKMTPMQYRITHKEAKASARSRP